MRDALHIELGEVGRCLIPLEPENLLDREHLLACPAVVAHAGWAATHEKLAQSASTVLRDLIRKLSDDTDRLIAEAAFAVDEIYQGKPIGKRKELLAERYGVSKDVYDARRRSVFRKLIYGLRAPSSTSDVMVGVTPISPYDVGESATSFYYACVASHLLIGERVRMLGNDANLLREPNLTLYEIHVTFLLMAHRYIHTLPKVESIAGPELGNIFERITAAGPLKDIVYLAYIYGGLERPEVARGAPNEKADLLLRTTWRAWYVQQELHHASADSELHALSVAVAEFRNTLPVIPLLDPAGELTSAPKRKQLARELKTARAEALQIFSGATAYEVMNKDKLAATGQVLPRVLSDVLDTPQARDEWLAAITKRLEDEVGTELLGLTLLRDHKEVFDSYIAFLLHAR